ncbi:MAG TPA: PQQ-dependent sugar dehydrogenase [Opitutaceae bacterium]|jgi:glucose/arabinose dehydrogenase
MSSRQRAGIFGIIGAILLAAAVSAQPVVPSAGAPALSVVNAFPNLTFQDPTFMLPMPGTDQLVVAGREGQFWSFTNASATATKTLFLDLSAHTQGWSDSGVLGFAFHPQFGQRSSPNRGYVYVWYCYTPGPIVGSAANPPDYQTPCYDRLSRFTIPDGASTVDPNSEYVLINQFDRDLWHNGGAMFFGQDGYLYVTDGDEGGENDQYQMSQKTNVGVFGGVLRIDVNENAATSHPIRRQPVADPGGTVPDGWPATYTQGYYIPNDNPFVDPSGSTLEEFYAIGLRSPHRMTQDPVTGNIWLADVGQNLWEEIDLIQRGGNYEWGFKEGFAAGPDPQPATIIGVDSPPVLVYGHYNDAGCVIGGYVYRGTQFTGQLNGLYVFGDYDGNYVWTMNYAGANSTPTVNYLASLPVRRGSAGGLSSFAQDASNELYMLTMGPTASIYKFAPLASAGSLVNLSARASVGTGMQMLDAGFVVAGSGSKQFMLRGIGPALANYGVSDCLTDTNLQLDDQQGATITSNQHWCSGTQEAALESAAAASGAFALAQNSNDSALIASLGAGQRTILVTPGSGSSAVGLAEIYDLAPGTGPSLINLSARGQVNAIPGQLVGGFVVSGAPMRVMLRAVGPTLAQYGVTGALDDPFLTLYDSASTVIATDDNWGDTMGDSIAAESQLVGAFSLPAGSKDSALLVTLAPGTYTAQVTSNDNTTGIALLEVWVAP